MNIFEKISNIFKAPKVGEVSAIILCAGNSTRFSNGYHSKQFAEVGGKKAICRTLSAFQSCKPIREIILVVKKEDAEEFNNIVCENNFTKVECIVVGGETRQISAMRGFKHISAKSKYVAFHDGARCLVTPRMIINVLDEAKKHGAATAATKVTDTVKLADNNGFISKTINRESLWNVQTPQIFEKNLYSLCIEFAKTNGINATDDCMLAEAYGQKVKLVDTGKDNIKITVREDIAFAESILRLREEEV